MSGNEHVSTLSGDGYCSSSRWLSKPSRWSTSLSVRLATRPEWHSRCLLGCLADDETTAVAVLRGDSNIKGNVTFEQGSEGAPTTVSWDITGHDASAKRGMHVHAYGDNTNGCTSAGPHCKRHFFSKCRRPSLVFHLFYS